MPLTKGQERNRSQLYAGPTVSHPSWTLLRKGLENEGRRETTDTIRTQHNGKRKERNNETMVIEKQEKRRRNSYAKNESRTALPGDDALQTSKKKTRAFIPDEVKHTSERTKKTRTFIPCRGSPCFVTAPGPRMLEHGKKIDGVLRYGKLIRRYTYKGILS